MKTIVIIGGGWSGTLTAIQLLENSKNISVKIVNSGQPFGLGIAFSTTDSEHLLNVPAGRMSAFPNKQNHFVDWLIANNYSDNNLQDQFVPRIIYGKYILELFNYYKSNPQLKLIDAKATNIEKNGINYTISLSNSSKLIADKIVLALGNFIPSSPKSNTPEFFESPYYFQNPWNEDYLKNIPLNQNILLIGTGLTMVDSVLSIKKTVFTGKIFVVSPKGYTPAPHGKSDNYPDFYSEIKDRSMLEIFSTVRKHFKIAESKNISWRAVVDSLRPHVQKIWVELSDKGKQQFISHIRHVWGVARHRLPVVTHQEIFNLKESGQLEIIGGRLLDMQVINESTIVSVRLRKSSEIRKLTVGRVINCTGPQTNYIELKDELVVNLLIGKIIFASDLKMGIQTTLTGRVLQEGSKPSNDIFAIGSLLRGVLWETTAVPEIRIQAESIAKQIIDSIK